MTDIVSRMAQRIGGAAYPAKRSTAEILADGSNDYLRKQYNDEPLDALAAGVPRERVGQAWPGRGYEEQPGAMARLMSHPATEKLGLMANFLGPAARMPVSRAGNPQLPMDQASRMARARDMGFRENMPLYHGTATSFDEFNLSQGGRVSGSRAGQTGVSVSRTPDVANEFAEHAARATGGDPRVIPLLHRAERPAALRLDGTERNLEIAATLQGAWDAGHDAVLLRNYTTPNGLGQKDVLIVKSPNQLRSPNAAFDPAKRDSANLLASHAAPAVAASAALIAAEQDKTSAAQRISERLIGTK